MFVLIGNKLDLESNRKVSFEEGKKFADKNGMKFFEIGDNKIDIFDSKSFTHFISLHIYL